MPHTGNHGYNYLQRGTCMPVVSIISTVCASTRAFVIGSSNLTCSFNGNYMHVSMFSTNLALDSAQHFTKIIIIARKYIMAHRRKENPEAS
ncbi:hypothetical protein TanjilG_31163 [Lupinus angustifolius]|uniref:Uncharacterized protein n=1 Tax=Lupinus angustifolius TaxID=3871 RepID=A0A1J7HA12_LUPAN|nr:hypothetical protein TanjilG_31163 [Lupinus angustifolius]